MTIKNIIRPWILLPFLAAAPSSPLAAQSAETSISGIIEYVFDPNPQEITPKLYNWEIKLNSIDSRTGAYEIVQITKPLRAEPNAHDSASVLIDSRMIV